ncbi:MAG: Gfo/Idh/MocA family oxidoreductase [Clostridia bacterium]|nr:Gfo/Idh/MocA family oxidoreductase [Clostridia bacterium]
MIRVAVVGAGGIALSHLNGYKELENTELVAVCDIQGEAASRYALATEMGARFYTDIDEMLENEKLDMLDVCTPTPIHAEMVKKGFAKGLHVLSEKPMCRTSGECEELIGLAKECGRCYMVAHVVRFMAPYRYLRSVIESGELGRPVHIFMRRLSTVPRWSYNDWMMDPAQSGGAPLDLSIHDIDFVYSVFGEPREVSAVYRKFEGKDSLGCNDYISSELVYDGFTASIIGAQYYADIPFTAEFLAVFENGTVELRGGKLYRSGAEIDPGVKEEKGEDTGINISSSSAYTDEIAYFIGCIERGEKPSFVTPESSMGSVRLVERILKSAIRI